jgi:hypothetical protein
MTLKRTLGTATIAAGLGIAALFGLGAGVASADPGRPCNAPGQPVCGDQRHDDGHGNDRGPAPAGWQQRGIDQGRQDHQPFNWNGVQVTPMRAGNGAGWGFWFLGTWIPM